jgi:hypothetical protein
MRRAAPTHKAATFPPALHRPATCAGLRPQINNAGILPELWSRQALELCVATNVAGPVTLTQQLLPHMAQGSTVVMVSSGERRGTVAVPCAAGGGGGRSGWCRWAAMAHCFEHGMSSRWQLGGLLGCCRLDMASTIAGEATRNCLRRRTGMGGTGAERSAKQGAASVVWCVEHGRQAEVHGGFFRDGERMEW